MRQVIREVMPNELPMILQCELSEKGNVLVDSVRVIPLTPCMECEECQNAEDDMPLACARLGEPQACPNDEQNKKLAIRLHLLLRQ